MIKRTFWQRLKVYTYKYPPVRVIQQWMHGTKRPKKWLFVVGCYNSGTNLLTRMLGAHPNVSIVPAEGHRLTPYLARPETFGWNRMWCECFDEVTLEPKVDRDTARKIIRDLSPFYSRSRDVFVEKSIPNTTRMEWLDINFDNAYFIGLIRNPYPVCEGIRRRARPGPPVSERLGTSYPIEYPARQWLASNELLRENGPKMQRFKLVRYETLVSSPVTELGSVLEFIGESVPAMSFEDGYFSIGEKSEAIQNLNDESVARLSKQDIETINRVLATSIAQFDYQVIQAGRETVC